MLTRSTPRRTVMVHGCSFCRNCQKPGSLYQIKYPTNPEQLQRMGALWMTQALRAGARMPSAPMPQATGAPCRRPHTPRFTTAVSACAAAAPSPVAAR